MATHARDKSGVELQTIYVNTNEDGGLTSGDYDNNANTDDDNVYLDLPYRSGFVRHRTRRANATPACPEKPKSTVQAKPRSRLLSDRNKEFMSSVKKRDVHSIQEQLETNPELADCSDDQGISALSEAAKSGPKLLEAFLQKIKDKRRLAVWIEHALLYAISANNYESVEYLLDKREKLMENEIRSHPAPLPTAAGNKKAKHQVNPGVMTWSDRHKTQTMGHLLAEFEDAEFPVYLTPIILASKLHRVEIVKLLLEKPFASEIHPLTASCPLNRTDECEICREQQVFKSKRKVEESRRLLEIYKALSSPTYILNSGVKDPVLEAFELSREMRNLSIEDAPFKAEYDAINKSCREFACDLLDLCRSTEEIETLLSVTKGIEDADTCPQNVELQRLIVAVGYGQKEFLTHPSCQQVLQRKWYEGLPNWVCETEWRSSGFLVYVFLWCLCWPFACIGFMLKLLPQLITFMKHPINKFISDTISFAWFLALLTIECNNNNKESAKASDIFTITEFLIIAWVLGMLARLVKMIWRHRRSCLCSVSVAAATRQWRWYEMMMLSCFIIWVVLHVIGLVMAYVSHREHTERHKWDQFDLLLISEGFFSLGTLLSFIKLIGLFKASSSLGPLQISLKLMLKDILRFLLIFFITMTGFVMALTNIYSHYEGHHRVEKHQIAADQTEHLVMWRNTYKTLFWALFGYGEPSVADVVVGNIHPDDEMTMDDANTTEATMEDPDVVKHKVTEFYGYMLFGSYHIVAIIVLINMLIAMMARSYEVIAGNSDMEWKYARTKLRMIYFSEVGSLPPPFNILILGSVMKRAISCCTKCCRCCRDRYETGQSSRVGDYDILVEKLGKRYLNKQAKRIKQQKPELSDDQRARIASIISEKKAHASSA